MVLKRQISKMPKQKIKNNAIYIKKKILNIALFKAMVSDLK